MSDLVSSHNRINSGGYVLSYRVRKSRLRVLAKGSDIGNANHFVGHGPAGEGFKHVNLIVRRVGAVVDELTTIRPVRLSDGVQEEARLSFTSEVRWAELSRDL
jgi:hypothetical protein